MNKGLGVDFVRKVQKGGRCYEMDKRDMERLKRRGEGGAGGEHRSEPPSAPSGEGRLTVPRPLSS